MQIHIMLDVTETSSKDAAVLRTLADALADEGAPTAAVIQMADRKAEQATTPAASPEKPRRTRKAAAPKEPAPEPSEESQEADEDLLGAPTLDTAVDKATAMVAAGKGAALKAALKAVGVAKVRDLDEDQIQEFLDACEEAE